jgi:hypothetical protein
VRTPSAPTAFYSPTPPAPRITTLAAVDSVAPDSNEAELGREEEDLWLDHNRAKSSAHKTSKNLKLVLVAKENGQAFCAAQ